MSQLEWLGKKKNYCYLFVLDNPSDYSMGKTTGSARAGSMASTGGILSYNW
jgi:hypothetical protein